MNVALPSGLKLSSNSHIQINPQFNLEETELDFFTEKEHLILDNLIQLAKAQNLHTMIGVIDSENQSSIEFHEKFGFEIAGTIKESGYKFNRWLHSVFMQKML